mmetsp:Transcript_14933/g.30774  ORF Transcript_14933/g.30774 Transcript_14933/m.30774 type:complete len:205 (-) Transcript_14933:558-1172(-)
MRRQPQRRDRSRRFSAVSETSQGAVGPDHLDGGDTDMHHPGGLVGCKLLQEQRADARGVSTAGRRGHEPGLSPERGGRRRRGWAGSHAGNPREARPRRIIERRNRRDFPGLWGRKHGTPAVPEGYREQHIGGCCYQNQKTSRSGNRKRAGLDGRRGKALSRSRLRIRVSRSFHSAGRHGHHSRTRDSVRDSGRARTRAPGGHDR